MCKTRRSLSNHGGRQSAFFFDSKPNRLASPGLWICPKTSTRDWMLNCLDRPCWIGSLIGSLIGYFGRDITHVWASPILGESRVSFGRMCHWASPVSHLDSHMSHLAHVSYLDNTHVSSCTRRSFQCLASHRFNVSRRILSKQPWAPSIPVRCSARFQPAHNQRFSQRRCIEAFVYPFTKPPSHESCRLKFIIAYSQTQ